MMRVAPVTVFMRRIIDQSLNPNLDMGNGNVIIKFIIEF